MSDDIYIPPHKRIIDSSGETSPDGGGFNFVFYDRTKIKGGKKKKPIPPIGDAVSVNLSTDALGEIKEQQVPENSGMKIEDRIPERDDQEASEFEGNVQKNNAVSLSLSTNALTEIREKRETELPDAENKEQKKTEDENSSHESGSGHINITV